MQAAFRGYRFRKAGEEAADAEALTDGPRLSASAARKKAHEQS